MGLADWIVSILCAGTPILIGLIYIFKRDWAWRVQEFSTRLNGISSERTDTWDAGVIIFGVTMLAIGYFLIRLMTNGN